jgi:hypothetical protein
MRHLPGADFALIRGPSEHSWGVALGRYKTVGRSMSVPIFQASKSR